jgi:hypothetical protein
LRERDSGLRPALLALALGWLLLGVPGAAATTFGVNAQKLVFEQQPSEWGRNFAAIREAGLQTVRIDALWQAAEPDPPVGGRHRYRWQRLDAIAAGLARQRLRWLPVVGYSTDWAGTRRGDHRSPPRDPRLYADFARALAQRYGRGGAFWRANRRLPHVPVTDYEIWNAPNFRATSFPPAPYARAYLAVRRAIRGVDSRASVWVGGLADRAPAFLTAMYAAEPRLKGNVDAVGLHPYADDIAGVLRKTARLRQTLRFLGEGDVPIAITELGWAIFGRSPVPHATDSERALLIAPKSSIELGQRELGHLGRRALDRMVQGKREPEAGRVAVMTRQPGGPGRRIVLRQIAVTRFVALGKPGRRIPCPAPSPTAHRLHLASAAPGRGGLVLPDTQARIGSEEPLARRFRLPQRQHHPIAGLGEVPKRPRTGPIEQAEVERLGQRALLLGWMFMPAHPARRLRV